MKLAGLFVLACCLSTSATTYYVSNAGTDAPACTSVANPCRTLAYVDANVTLNAGDSVLLQRGGVWNEPLIAAASGVSGSPITYDAYGTGAAPVITPAIDGSGATWSYVSGNIYSTTLSTSISSPQIYNLRVGQVWGKKRAANPSCTTAGVIQGYGDFCVSWPTMYVYSPSGTVPSAYYGAIVPVVSQAAGLAMVSVVNKSWLVFQHIKIQNFDYMGVSVTGTSDNLVFANMESDGMVPYGATPHGFYVNASGAHVQFANDDAHLNYDGFHVEAAGAVTVMNCRAYANRDAGLRDNNASGPVVTYSNSHFYGNNVAQLLASDVVGGTSGSGNIGLVCGAGAGFSASATGTCSSMTAPVVTNVAMYPARFSFTVDDVGSSSGTEAYINSFLSSFSSRGIHFNAAVVPSYSVDWGSVNNWYAGGNEIDSHSWSHQYYTTAASPQDQTPYPNAPALVIQYAGSGSAATLSIAGGMLSTNVTGAPGDNIPATNLGSYSAATLYQHLQSVPNYVVQQNSALWTTSNWPLSRPNTDAQNLLAVSAQDIKSAPFTLLYDQTALLPDEMSSSRSAIQSHVSGLQETFYVYPDGLEDPTTEAISMANGYTAARGSLSMKDQNNKTTGANSFYSNGVNVQNITSLAAIPMQGKGQGQIKQIAASLVFRAAAWGAPYGLFVHYNTRGDLAGDISNGELGWLLDAITANGGLWLTNLGLANSITGGTSISGTTRYVQNPSGGAVNLAVAQANSPTVGRGAATTYPVDLNGMDRSKLGAWDVGASAFVSQRYGMGAGVGSSWVGGWVGH